MENYFFELNETGTPTSELCYLNYSPFTQCTFFRGPPDRVGKLQKNSIGCGKPLACFWKKQKANWAYAKRDIRATCSHLLLGHSLLPNASAALNLIWSWMWAGGKYQEGRSGKSAAMSKVVEVALIFLVCPYNQGICHIKEGNAYSELFV